MLVAVMVDDRVEVLVWPASDVIPDVDASADVSAGIWSTVSKPFSASPEESLLLC